MLLVLGNIFPALSQKDMAEYNKAMNYLDAKGEVYFSFDYNTRAQVQELTSVISIDNIKYGMIYAYANKLGFEKFLQYNLFYEVLRHPGEMLEEPKMAHTPEELIREWDSYPTYPNYVAMMEKFQADYPTLCRIIQYGTSGNGRKLLYAKISDNVDQVEAEPRHMYSSAMHGDEICMYVNFLRLIDYLLKNYNTNAYVKKLVDNVEIWICPLENPDGTYKTGDQTVNGAVRFTKNGVDLNRHFPSPSNGPHPDGLSKYEPECTAVMKLVDTCQFVLSANTHGGAELLNYPYDFRQARHQYDSWMKYVYRKFADTVHSVNANILTGQNNGITNGFDWYQIFGSRMDYCTYYRYMREVTYEASAEKNLTPSKLPTYWNAYYKACLQYIEQNLFGINGKVINSITKKGIRAKVFVKSVDADSSFTYSKVPHGDYYRPIIAGTYTLEFSRAGYYPKTVSNIVVQNDKATVVDVELDSIGTGIHFTGNLSGAAIGIMPYNRGVRIVLSNPETQNNNIQILDITGKTIKNIVATNSKEILWNGINNNGQIAANGCYIVKIGAGKQALSRSFVLSR